MLDYLESGEQYMENSLPWDQVEDVRYNPWNGPRFAVKSAQKRSEEYVAGNKKLNRIEQESVKAKQRAEETLVANFLAGVVAQRKELERARKEAKEAGIISEGEDQDGTKIKEKESLDEQLADDPYVHLTLFLMDDISATEHVAGRAE
jgi:carboxyl-terminal processing protease